jgi:queuosine precursor transporter
MTNILIFCSHIIFVCLLALFALRMGQATLTSFVGLLFVAANLFVTKQIGLFGLTVTTADALGVGAVLSLNLLQEYFGRQAARRALLSGTFIGGAFVLLSWFQVAYHPVSSSTYSNAFTLILSATPRIVLASLVTFFLVQQLEYRLYGYLKTYFKNKHFVLRNYLCTGITQLIDTVLFGMLGLYGTLDNIGHIILFSYSIKLFVILLGAPMLQLARTIIVPTSTGTKAT